MNFSVNAQDLNQSGLKFNQKSNSAVLNLLNRFEMQDSQKPKSQNLIKESSSLGSDSVSNQSDNLKVKFQIKDKKIIIQNKEQGDVTVSLTLNQNIDSVDQIDNKLVYTTCSGKVNYVSEAIEGGFRQVINIQDSTAPNTYDFPIDLQAGEQIVANGEGSFAVKKPDGSIKVSIAKPWAKDANGKDLRTNYSVINGNLLRQSIDFKGAVFPVVADPY